MLANLLLVEDDPEIANVFCDTFRHEGYAVTWATTGLERWGNITSSTYDLVLVDLMLPEMDGLTLCKNIRWNSDLSIVMISAHQEEGTVFGEQDFWMDTEDWVILKMISKSANIKTELVYMSIVFSSDFKGEVFTLDILEDAEVETLDTDFSGKEIELEEMIDILGEGVLYVPEGNGITIDHISLIEMDAQTNYVDIAYKKDGIAFITLSIISPATDDIEEQIELFGNDAEEVQVRNQNGMYINAKLLQSLVWNEDNFQYNLDMMDPSLIVDGLLDLTEAMKKVE